MAVKVKKNAPQKPKKSDTSKPVKSEVVEPQVATPLVALRNEIDQMFENVLSGMPSMRLSRPHFDMDFWRDPMFRDPLRRFEGSLASLSKLSPRADMKETDKSVSITVELPGVAEGDIDVSVTEGRITISAEKKDETRTDDEDYHLTERHYGSVKRSFALPETCDADKAKASFKGGVLSIDVPKKAVAKSATKKIPVQT